MSLHKPVSKNSFFRSDEIRKVSKPSLSKNVVRLIRGIFLKLMIILLFIGIACFIWTEIKRDEIFTVRKIEITGCVFTEPSVIRREFENITGMNMFSIDIGRIKESIDKLPWVMESSVVRKVPDTLQIHIKEFTPVGIVNLNGKFYLASNRGLLIEFKQSARLNKSLPIINLSKDKDDELSARKISLASEFLHRIRQNFPMILDITSEVLVSDDLRISVILTGDNNLLMVNQDNDGSELVKYLGLVHEIKKRFVKPGIVDLRFNGQVVIRGSELTAEKRL